jgi:molybdopterin-guanine dinucleotide biosynthesis protein A
MDRAGVVLAGGYSTRFGDRDKVLAPVAGEPMVRRVVRRVREAVDRVVVNCRADQVDALREALAGAAAGATPRFAVDPTPDRGPLAGIHAGLSAVDAPYAAVVAADMPLVTPALLDHLFERAAGHDAAVVESDEGWYHTTQAVYRTDAVRDGCERALAGEDGRILAALEGLDWVAVPADAIRTVASPDTFTDVNTPADLAAVERGLRDRWPGADDAG